MDRYKTGRFPDGGQHKKRLCSFIKFPKCYSSVSVPLGPSSRTKESGEAIFTSYYPWVSGPKIPLLGPQRRTSAWVFDPWFLHEASLEGQLTQLCHK